jgi:hypothetical protein
MAEKADATFKSDCIATVSSTFGLRAEHIFFANDQN